MERGEDEKSGQRLERVMKDALQPIGVFPNSRTVWLIISSGSEVMSVERMNHCLPAVGEIQKTILELMRG